MPGVWGGEKKIFFKYGAEEKLFTVNSKYIKYLTLCR